jgi:CarboxypepD_reg-like domain
MLSSDDHIIKRLSDFAFLFLLIYSPALYAQVNVLDSVFTFRAGTVKTGNALNLISQKTGYYFTYDTKIIDPERKTEMSFNRVRLRSILDSLLKNDTLRYSVINKYIIVYKSSSSPEVSEVKTEWKFRNITGIISDSETGEPLPFATIGINSIGKGTVTNNNGEFGLKITPECVNDSLSVSYLGYYTRQIPVKQAFDNNFNIKMRREYVSIPEIIVHNQAPQEILRKAFSSIQHNFGTTAAELTGFYREAVMKKSELQIYSEAILHIYKSAYSGTFFGDQIKVIKSRKIENIGRKDTLTVRLKAGLNSCLQLDGARNIFDFLLPENFQQYDYRMTDIVTVGDESAFVIEFIQKPGIEIPLFKGTIYINTYNFAIEQAEFEVNSAYIQKTKENYISSQSKSYSIWPVTVRYSVSYRKINDRYFLNHVRGDLGFIAKQKKRLFNTSFNVFFELAITDMTLKNVSRFDREEVAPVHSVFSRTIKSYDPVFWGNQDFLKPEDNLLQALKNMNVKLQEFSK